MVAVAGPVGEPVGELGHGRAGHLDGHRAEGEVAARAGPVLVHPVVGVLVEPGVAQGRGTAGGQAVPGDAATRRGDSGETRALGRELESRGAVGRRIGDVVVRRLHPGGGVDLLAAALGHEVAVVVHLREVVLLGAGREEVDETEERESPREKAHGSTVIAWVWICPGSGSLPEDRPSSQSCSKYGIFY